MLADVRHVLSRQPVRDAVLRVVAPGTAALLDRSISAGQRFASVVAEEPLTSLQQQVEGGVVD